MVASEAENTVDKIVGEIGEGLHYSICAFIQAKNESGIVPAY